MIDLIKTCDFTSNYKRVKGHECRKSSSPKPSGLEKHSTVEPDCPAHAAINGGVSQSSILAEFWCRMLHASGWRSHGLLMCLWWLVSTQWGIVIIGNHFKYGSNQEFLKIFETNQSWNQSWNTSWWTVKFSIDGTGWWHYSDWGHRKIPEASVNFVSDVLSWIEMLRTVTVSRSGPRYLQQTQN